jgi:streptomycin 6-kinase
MTDPITARLAHRFGAGIATWARTVPSTVDDLARRWHLAVGELIPDGASSAAFRVTVDGRKAVLKLGPDERFLAEQAAVLRLCAPTGRVPAVLADAPGALLMAAVEPGVEYGDRAAPSAGAYAALLADLHTVAPPATLGRDLRGDLHLGNVLEGGPHGLTAIDPKPCVGDRCFDAVDYVVAGATQEGIEPRLRAMATAADLDPDRLRAWARQVAAITAIPLLRDGGHQQAVDELLTLARRPRT